MWQGTPSASTCQNVAQRNKKEPPAAGLPMVHASAFYACRARTWPGARLQGRRHQLDAQPTLPGQTHGQTDRGDYRAAPTAERPG